MHRVLWHKRMREKTTSEVHIVVALFCRATFRSFCVRLVEHAAVNRRVVGSSPTGGAIEKAPKALGFWSFFLFKKLTYIILKRVCQKHFPTVFEVFFQKKSFLLFADEIVGS